MLDFLALLWYVIVLTGGATHEQPDKRTMARQHNTQEDSPNQFARDEGTAHLYGKASRGTRKELQKRAEGNLENLPFGCPSFVYTDEFLSVATLNLCKRIKLKKALQLLNIKQSNFYYHIRKIKSLNS